MLIVFAQTSVLVSTENIWAIKSIKLIHENKRDNSRMIMNDVCIQNKNKQNTETRKGLCLASVIVSKHYGGHL